MITMRVVMILMQCCTFILIDLPVTHINSIDFFGDRIASTVRAFADATFSLVLFLIRTP